MAGMTEPNGHLDRAVRRSYARAGISWNRLSGHEAGAANRSEATGAGQPDLGLARGAPSETPAASVMRFRRDARKRPCGWRPVPRPHEGVSWPSGSGGRGWSERGESGRRSRPRPVRGAAALDSPGLGDHQVQAPVAGPVAFSQYLRVFGYYRRQLEPRQGILEVGV